MLYVLEMSNDADIIATQLAPQWPAPAARYTWGQVSVGGLAIPAGSDIIVIAHGNNDEIGNAAAGVIDIDAAAFLALVFFNMGGAPANIYISACGQQFAGFAANVALLAGQNNIWAHTIIHGHYDPVVGTVPPPTALSWVAIYP